MSYPWQLPTVLALLLAPLAAQAPEPPVLEPDSALREIFAGGVPKTLEDLRAMQEHIERLFARVLPSVVGVGGGSGVLIEGGYVLTAGHVNRTPGRETSIVLADGRRVRAKALGANYPVDAGLLQVLGDEKLPSVPLGRSGELREGQWCIALGHPGGWQRGRTPPLRLGRVLHGADRGYLTTDCTIEAGDSGGPLFDMEGRVIGIHSRIANSLTANMHVPVDAFHDRWEELVAGKVEGAPPARGAYLGIEHDRGVERLKVVRVIPGTAAAQAGVEAGDVILRLAGRPVGGGDSLTRMLQRYRPGARVKLEVRRGEDTVELTVTLGRREE